MKLRLGSLLLAFVCLAGWTTLASAQIQFDRPKTEPPLPNPYTINIPRDQILKTVREVLKTCSIPVDEEASKPVESKLVTKYVVFTKGVTARTDLEHLSNLPASEVHNWTQGRYSLEINALPLDEKRSQLQVIVRLQGQVADVVGTKWIDSPSNGTAEDEILRSLASRILGIDLSLNSKNRRRIFNCEF